MESLMARVGLSKSEIIRLMVVENITTRKGLCATTGLSKGSVTQIVNSLIEAGMVEEGTKFNNTERGRKTTTISARNDLAYFIGTDLEGLAVRACIMDSTRQVLASDKKAVSPDWTQKQIEKHWQELVETVISRSQIEKAKIAGIGIGLPGLVSTENFTCQAYLPPGRWLEFNAERALADFKLPVFAANNVYCVSEYERFKGCAGDFGDFVSVLIRYGIGLSLYLAGKPVLSSNISAGELGHMQIDINGPRCICGEKGCLDAYIAGRSWDPDKFRTGKELEKELSSRAEYLAVALSNVIKILHVPVILFNGIYNEYAHIIEPVLDRHFDKNFKNLNYKTPKILFGEPYELKASVGAALRAADSFLSDFLDKKYFLRETA